MGIADKPILLIRNIHLDAFGGAETYQISLAKELKKLGRTPIIVSSSKPLRRAARHQGIKAIQGCYFPHQNWSGYRNLFLPFYFLWQIAVFLWYLITILRFRPQALHIQNRDDMIAGTLAGKITGTRVIWTDHSDLRLVIWENIDKKYKNPIGKIILKLAKYPYKITTISDYDYNYITKLIAPKKLNNFIVVKNGVEDQLSKYQTIKSTPQSICHVGRIIDYKGIKELIDAFNLISQKYPKAVLNLYGDGPDLPIFRAYAEKNSKITFHGHTSEPLKALAKNQIFVLASYHEGLSLALLDAAMMQKAIIATNIDGNPEIVLNQKTGLLIQPKDEKSLAKALEILLESPKLAQKYAAAARKLYQQQYDFSTIVKNKMEPLYYEKS